MLAEAKFIEFTHARMADVAKWMHVYNENLDRELRATTLQGIFHDPRGMTREGLEWAPETLGNMYKVLERICPRFGSRWDTDSRKGSQRGTGTGQGLNKGHDRNWRKGS